LTIIILSGKFIDKIIKIRYNIINNKIINEYKNVYEKISILVKSIYIEMND